MNRAFTLAFKKVPSLYATKMIRTAMVITPKRFYFPTDQLMTRDKGEYFSDPKEIAEKVIKLFSLHDKVADPSKVTLNTRFEDLGLNDFDVAEILLMSECLWNYEISDDS